MPRQDQIALRRKDAESLSHAVMFLLAQDLSLLRPGNWRASEWAVTVSGWRKAAETLKAAIAAKKQ